MFADCTAPAGMSKPISFSGVPCQVFRYTWPSRLPNQVGKVALLISQPLTARAWR